MAADDTPPLIDTTVVQPDASLGVPFWVRRTGVFSWLLIGFLIAFGAVVVLIAALSAIVVPVILAVALAVVFAPVVDWLVDQPTS